jgi:hypothetical protein
MGGHCARFAWPYVIIVMLRTPTSGGADRAGSRLHDPLPRKHPPHQRQPGPERQPGPAGIHFLTPGRTYPEWQIESLCRDLRGAAAAFDSHSVEMVSGVWDVGYCDGTPG